MIIYIITAIDIALSALFAILNKFVWSGFTYFVLSLLLALALCWGGWLIYKYFTSYRQEQMEEFERYKVEQINKLKTKDYEKSIFIIGIVDGRNGNQCTRQSTN